MGNKPIEKLEDKKEEKILYSNGEHYEGEIVDKIRHGFGVHHYKNGDRYDGMWYNNMKHGTGILFYKNGDFYDGWWQNDIKEGVGTYFYNNGDRYYGEWKDNKKQGKGFIYCDDGSKFIGEFKNNKKNGKGEFICKTGANYYQDWKDGILVKQVEKYKVDKMDYIDYRDLNSNSFEKYLENKNNQNVEIKSMKSKYLSLEFAKYLKSKHPEGFYDSMRIVKNNNLLLEKPDIILWTCQEVCVWLRQLGFNKNIEKVIENKIDGKILLRMESTNFANVLGIIDENEIILITKSMDLLKKLHNQNDYLKSITKSSFKQNKDNAKANDIGKLRKIVESRLIDEKEDKLESYQETNKIREDNNGLILKDLMLDKIYTKEEDKKIEEHNEEKNKLDRMNELEQTHGKEKFN